MIHNKQKQNSKQQTHHHFSSSLLLKSSSCWVTNATPFVSSLSFPGGDVVIAPPPSTPPAVGLEARLSINWVRCPGSESAPLDRVPSLLGGGGGIGLCIV